MVADSRVVTATLETLRSCGQGRTECILYWVARQDDAHVVRAVHPKHTASWSGYRVDDDWINAFFLDLGRHAEHVIAQVHSHPTDWVGMSETDDRWVLLPSPGFYSVVVPELGQADSTAGWGVWTLASNGAWVGAEGDVEWTIG